MTTIKNTSQAVRVINAKVDGKIKAVAIEPGASVDAESVKTKAFNGAVDAGHLSVGAAKAAPDMDPDKLTVEELKAHLTDKGVQFPDDAKKADLVALAKK